MLKKSYRIEALNRDLIMINIIIVVLNKELSPFVHERSVRLGQICLRSRD